MEFRILGPLEIVDDGATLRLGSGRQLAVVAILLLNANEAVSVDRMVDEIWGESAPPTAPKIVRNYVSLLRKELGDRVVTAPPGYLLRVEDGELDSQRLEQAVRRGDETEIGDALAQWRGPPLAQFAFDGFAQDTIARLEELRLVATEARNDAELARGRHAELIPELEALVRQCPLRERLRAQLMLALYRSGRQADALESYRRGSTALRDELGIEPGPDLRDLERRILNQDESLGGAHARADEAVPTPRPSRSARAWVIGAAAVVVVVFAVAYVSFRDTAAARIDVPPNTVGLIDTTTNTVVATVPVSIRPGPVVAANGIVWVANLGDRNLTRIEAKTHAALGTVDLERTPTALAASADAVWVAHALTGELSRVESRFGHDVMRAEVARGGRPTAGVAVAPDAVWAAFGDSSLVRVDPETLRPVGIALAGAAPAAVAVRANAIWVANAGDATVLRFDTVTFEEGPVRSTSVGNLPIALAYGAGALWVANRDDDSVTRIDPSTNATVDIRVGREPTGIAAVGNAVWVANSGDGTVSRIDAASNDVVATIDVGNAPSGIAVTDGIAWVTVQAI